jgi:hypothetical protein
VGDKSVERPREDWRHFLEQVTKEHEDFLVTIEVFSREFGDGYEVEKLPFEFIEFDNKDDVIIVAVGGRDSRYPVVLRHIVWHPQQLLADPPDPSDVKALEIIDRDDVRTVISLLPPQLPVPVED